MTVRGRLIATIFAIAALLLVPAIYSVLRLRDVNRIASDQLQQHAEAYVDVTTLAGHLTQLDADLRAYVSFLYDNSFRDAARATIGATHATADQLAQRGYGEPLAGFIARIDSVQTGMSFLEQLGSEGLSEDATSYLEDQVEPTIAGARSVLSNLRTDIDDRSQADLLRAQSISSAAVVTTIIAIVICATLAVVLGLWTTSALTAPVTRLEGAMAIVADGEFLVPDNLPYDRPDEIGSVSRSFRSMTHRLADLDRLRAELMSIATHELKTPINVIMGFSELMKQRIYGELNEKQIDAVESIHDQARVMTDLVNQLLDMSRLEAGGLRLSIAELDVRELIERATNALEALVAKKRIEFVVTVEDKVPAVIQGDADRLADQVLGNLLSNAVKFTPEGGKITLRAWQEDKALNIEVADTGPGIPEDQLANIFDMFYQVGEGARSKGAGLGLAIASEVVVAHGGRITAASDPGEGARFRISLPVPEESEPEPTLGRAQSVTG